MYKWYTHLYAKKGGNRRYKNPPCRRCACGASCASGNAALERLKIYSTSYTNYWCCIMPEEIITIRLNKSVVKALKQIKKYPRETYSEIILGFIESAKEMKEFDKFVQESQRTKMKELWCRGNYSAWERA